jgi:hypothetical protein
VRAIRTAALLLPLALASYAHAGRGPPPPGRYSSVVYIAEADDDLGVNLEIQGSGATRTVIYEDCEGACHGSTKFPATVWVTR